MTRIPPKFFTTKAYLNCVVRGIPDEHADELVDNSVRACFGVWSVTLPYQIFQYDTIQKERFFFRLNANSVKES
jgi:hypothetical protein